MIRSLLTVAATAVLALTIVSPAAAADCPTGTGTGATFNYTGDIQQIAVPAGIDRVQVEVRGAHGGQYDTTAPGGVGGLVTGTIPVTVGECLSIYVGRQGRHDGGWGYGEGGEQGNAPDLPPPVDGHSAGGGGGGSAVTRGDSALVVAGGDWGGVGGDGVGGDGPGTPRGEDGFAPRFADNLNFGGEGGWGGDGTVGGDGGSAYWDLIGGGGGGGGGWKGGDGGEAWFEQEDQPNLPYGGGGGGGGSSHAASAVTDVQFTRADTTCRPDHDEPGCEGQVSLSWIQQPAGIAAAGGQGQRAAITDPFSLPLRAKVTARSGDPVPGATVVFQLPGSGPSATFPEGSTTATATTGADGIASAPAVTAGPQAGRWTATASVTGVEAPARFDLEDLPASTATALQVMPSAVVDGEPVELVARVVADPASAGTATGEVLFTVDGAGAGDLASLDGDGVARLPGVALDAGKHTIAAHYGGDDRHSSSSSTLGIDVALAGSAVTLSSSEDPSEAGDPVTFSGQVAPVAPAQGDPSGEVQLLIDDVETAIAPLAPDGSVTWPAATLDTEGEHQIEARYLGDGKFAAGGATLVQAVGADASATIVSPSAPYAVYGEPLSWTVRIRSQLPGTPTGTVTVEAGGATICALPVLDGEAVCSPASSLDPGTYPIVATYSGDEDHAESHGSAQQDVVPAPASVSAEVDPGASVFGQRWRLHADVAASAGAPDAAPPTGAVRFTIDEVPVGEPIPLGADGATIADLPTPPAGPHVVGAVYSGDGRFESERAVATAVVSPALATVALTSSQPSAPAGAPVAFEAAVSPVPAGPTPTGAVRFLVDGRQRGVPVALDGGVARSPAWSDLAPGEHRIEAEYLGDTSHRPGLAQLTQTVTPSSSDGGASKPASPKPGSHPRKGQPCDASVAITRLREHGGRVRIAGLAPPQLEGRRVAIRLGGRRIAATTVRADGTFRASAPVPRGRQASRAPYRAAVAGLRSAAVTLRGAAMIRGRTLLDDGRITLALNGPPHRRFAAVADCPGERRIARAQSDGDGKARLTLAAPTTSVVAVYRLRVGHRAVPAPAIAVRWHR